MIHHDLIKIENKKYKNSHIINLESHFELQYYNCSSESVDIIGRGKDSLLIIDNCSFSKINIKGSFGGIHIKNSREKINQLYVFDSNGNNLIIKNNDINTFVIQKTGKLSRLEIENSNISLLTSMSFVEKLAFFNNSAKQINIYGKVIEGFISNRDTNHEINRIDFKIYNESKWTLREVSIVESRFELNKEKASISLKNSYCYDLDLKVFHESNCFINITRSIIDNFHIRGGVINHMFFSNLDLSKTLLKLENINHTRLNWDKVIWPKKIEHYDPTTIGAIKSTPIGIIRALKQKSIENEDSFSKLLFNSMEFNLEIENLRKEKWNNRPKMLKFFLNPFYDLFLVFFDKKKILTIGDKFILYVGKYTNNFGLSWFRAVIITLIGGGIIFYFYGLSLSPGPFIFGFSSFSDFWINLWNNIPNYIKFLNPTHDFQLIEGYKLNPGASLLDFLGRIYISFGYYQVIKAFRKFF